CTPDHPSRHSFPTRRSSDLGAAEPDGGDEAGPGFLGAEEQLGDDFGADHAVGERSGGAVVAEDDGGSGGEGGPEAPFGVVESGGLGHGTSFYARIPSTINFAKGIRPWSRSS